MFPIHPQIQNWDFLSVGIELYFQVFPIPKEILGFLNELLAGLLNFSKFMKKMESGFFEYKPQVALPNFFPIH